MSQATSTPGCDQGLKKQLDEKDQKIKE